MSQETMEWLNTMVLVGYTDLRGEAWHHDLALQNGEPNHYPQAIPVGDVVRRLFNFEVVSRPLFLRDSFDADGNVPGFVEVPDRQAMVAGPGAPFPGEVFGIFTDGFRGHAYREWLLENAERIMGTGLNIGSAGLLRKGAQAWVQYELEETREVRNVLAPVAFRPYLLAYTSYDGSLATGYKLGGKVAVCDNTFEIARSAKDGNQFRLKHTRYSTGRVLEARDALGVLFAQGDEMDAEITRLLETEVTNKVFIELVDTMVPLPVDKDGKVNEKGRGLTLALNKRDGIKSLYSHDDRVAPWAGTAWGALMAFNTFGHHVQTVKGTSRSQRIRSNAITGTQAKADAEVLETLEGLLAAAA